MELHDFHTGRAFDAYTYFGAHPMAQGVVFRTWAPAAVEVALIGDFNGWKDTMMEPVGQSGVFQCHLAGAAPGMMYKYKVYRPDGGAVEHCDPYGFGMELRPAHASVIRDLSAYEFSDGDWMAARGDSYNAPLNIYEVHLGSWRTDPDRENGWYRYEEIAGPLIEYVREMGYNAIELMPIAEHPLDASWGYQSTGFFAPTARYGDAAGLMALIDACHQAGIAVLLDFVPVHFAVDYYALAEYDGTALYEYPHSDVGVSEWGSYNFIHSRGEVRSFLQSAADYWLSLYHFDGLRMDAISRMIYWQGEPHRGVNDNAVAFLQGMNQGLHQRHRGALLIAEDSTDFPKVTAPVEYGGLGFDYKWDLGWMNDTLDYFKKTPEERVWNYDKLTFSMMYFYNELYLLPISHDESVHGKATVLQKMYGDYEGKFPQARAFYTYMAAHPGKKLNFMGGEFGQLREWDEDRAQDWEMLLYPIHDAFSVFMAELNALYLANPALAGGDYDSACFCWLDIEQKEKCTYVFKRSYGGQSVVAAFNFSDKDWPAFLLRLDCGCKLTPLLHSNWEGYGGSVKRSRRAITARQDKEGFYLKLSLPAFSGVLYQLEEMPAEKTPAKPAARARKGKTKTEEGEK